MELGEGIWEVTLVAGQTLGTQCLSFGPRVAQLGEELGASLSEKRGLDPGKKQIVARMGFLEVPLRAGRGPGPCQVAVPSTQLPGGGAAVPSTRASRALELLDSAWLDQRRSRTAKGAG